MKLVNINLLCNRKVYLSRDVRLTALVQSLSHRKEFAILAQLRHHPVECREVQTASPWPQCWALQLARTDMRAPFGTRRQLKWQNTSHPQLGCIIVRKNIKVDQLITYSGEAILLRCARNCFMRDKKPPYCEIFRSKRINYSDIIMFDNGYLPVVSTGQRCAWCGAGYISAWNKHGSCGLCRPRVWMPVEIGTHWRSDTAYVFNSAMSRMFYTIISF